jgi:hypothetical protein
MRISGGGTCVDWRSRSTGRLPADLDADRVASLLVVMIMGLAHLETLAPGRIGDAKWIAFLEASVGDLLRRSAWRFPAEAFARWHPARPSLVAGFSVSSPEAFARWNDSAAAAQFT